MSTHLRQTVRTSEDLSTLEAKVVASAQKSAEALARILAESKPLDALARVKFEQVGFHPIQDRALNFIEQINQTFTFIASLRAAAWIFSHHPEVGPLRLNLGTAAGSDIESLEGSLAAEAFAATTPGSNDKLRKDVTKVAGVAAQLKYVFYSSPAVPAGPPIAARTNPAVLVVSLGWTG